MPAEPGLEISLADLARLVGGRLDGDGELRISGFAGLEQAGPTDVSFCGRAVYRQRVASTAAAAVIVGPDFRRPSGCRDELALIIVEDPYVALATALDELVPRPPFGPGVHPSAVVEPDARLGEDVHVGARAVIGAGALVGDRSVIGDGTVLAAGARVGNDCLLYPNVTVYDGVTLGDRVIVHAGAVLGADGFGYAWDGTRHRKIPQVGGIAVGDDVEIGANACIDRATLGTTRIGPGTKIDNLVQIGHNCTVGAHCILCGQVGLGGTTTVGDGVVIGGQAGLSGHLDVGDGARIAAQTGVINDVAAGTDVAGYPHQEAAGWRRSIAAFRRLPELVLRVRRLERRVRGRSEEDA